MTKVTELSLFEKMSFLAYLQSSAHRVFHSAMNIMTCTNYTAKMKGIHSALFEWQLKNRHQPNFGPKNIYRSDSSVTSVTDRSDRSDSSVIRRLQKWQDRRPPAARGLKWPPGGPMWPSKSPKWSTRSPMWHPSGQMCFFRSPWRSKVTSQSPKVTS